MNICEENYKLITSRTLNGIFFLQIIVEDKL